MVRATFVLLSACSLLVGLEACTRGQTDASRPSASHPAALAGVATEAEAGALAPAATESTSGSAALLSPSPPAPWTPAGAAFDGPHEELSVDAGRPIYYALPSSSRPDAPKRLIGHIHGMCGPPSYACGKWIAAGTDLGVMICPTGNARCGDSPMGPPSWEAPAWMELVGIMDHDLEASIAKVLAKKPGTFTRDGAVLTGYSRGAYAAPIVASLHPGRWPYLVLIEANVPLKAASLETSKVKAVALVAGEVGTEIAGERKTADELEAAGFPVKVFVMRKTGHLYSDDMEQVMHDALAWVIAH